MGNNSNYDTIIVGAGIGGLTTGCLLAKRVIKCKSSGKSFWRAEVRTESIKQLIRDIKRIARRKFTAEEKIRCPQGLSPRHPH